MSKFINSKVVYDPMKDKEVIKKLGGAVVVAKFLNKKYTTVHNWTTRGIPAKYKLEYPELFLSENPPNLKQPQTPTDE